MSLGQTLQNDPARKGQDERTSPTNCKQNIIILVNPQLNIRNHVTLAKRKSTYIGAVQGLFTWTEEDPGTRKILNGGTTFLSIGLYAETSVPMVTKQRRN